MKRRKFISDLGIATAGAALSTSFYSGPHLARKPKVIIIGAGFSGLSAAARLLTISVETDPPISGETDPPVSGETDPAISGETDPPVSGETDPPVSGETDPPISGETDLVFLGF